MHQAHKQEELSIHDIEKKKKMMQLCDSDISGLDSKALRNTRTQTPPTHTTTATATNKQTT